jgi:hypothetical protein
MDMKKIANSMQQICEPTNETGREGQNSKKNGIRVGEERKAESNVFKP